MRQIVAVVGAVGLAVVLTAIAPAFAAVTIIQPSSQDAYILQDFPNRINGAQKVHTRIRVRSSVTVPRRRRGLVQFDLASIPTGATVSSAILDLYEGNDANANLIYGLYRATQPWLQSATKWNNQPPHVGTPSATAPVGNSTGFKSFDVTADVQAFVNACSLDHGWVLRDTAETATNEDVNFVSREESHPGALADRPLLTVTFTPPPCTVNADCADANFCTVNEQCIGGVCVVAPRNCDDADPCTDDICDCGAAACINAPICNDGFSCTVDTCNASNPDNIQCTNTKVNANCTTTCSSGICVADDADPDIDPATGCEPTVIQPNGTPCTPDSNACTLDQCQAGICAHPPTSSGSACDDSDLCTSGDACNGAGTCTGTPVVCTPSGQCHAAGTCNSLTGICSDPPSPPATPCQDGSLCTSGDLCDGAGGCAPGTPTICAPLSQCHDAGTCDGGTGICSNPPKPNGAGCDDGLLCTTPDTCDGAGTCAGAPVVCAPLDQCHLAGACDPDTGICSNPVLPNGDPCDDGNSCTIDDACSAGSCTGDPMTCGDLAVQASCGEECDDPGDPNCTAQCTFICPPTPDPGCRQPATAGKAQLLLKDKSPDKKDRLNWKYVKGAATVLGDFADPLGTGRYWLCVYDASPRPQPILFAEIPPAGTCAGKPCWKGIKGGFKRRDKTLAAAGNSMVLLKEGTATRTKILVQGKADNIPMPTLPLTPTVTVQLKNSDGVCWETVHGTFQKNVVDQYKAKAN